VVSHDSNGDVIYKEFNRYDFLRQDDAGNFYWLDDFIFSCDVTAPLANNREAMWQETRLNFQQGAFGNPAELETLIMFWTKMAELHYPGAEDTRDEMRHRLEQQQLMQQQMMMQQQALQQQVEEQARRQAAADVGIPDQQQSLALPPNMQSALDNMQLESDRFGGML
jgi:predicted transcriptional regulator